MVGSAVTERGLFAQLLEREYRNTARMLRAFPRGRLDEKPADCPRSGRAMAWAFVERERLMLYVLRGRTTGIGVDAPASMDEILAAHAEAHRDTRTALSQVTAAQWDETLSGPAGLRHWERARRGELLWMALRELVHHGAHFAIHLRLAQDEEAARVLSATA